MVLGQKYRLLSVLGEGGMGTVYEAENVEFQKRVAIKILRDDLAKDAKIRERFVREARASAKVDHPNVVQVFDVVDHRGVPLLVMELLRGESLAAYLDRCGPMDLESAFSVVEPVMRALEAAHRQGFVHRDLKPANIFLPVDGEGRPMPPKLLDFGIAAEQSGGDLVGPAGASRLTKQNAAMGTAYYMPLEQMRDASKATPRSDVYALGVTLFEMLTMALPYEADNISELTARMVEEPPRSLQMLRPDLGAGVVEAIHRCMQRRPEDRFASVAELRAALRPYGLESARALPQPEARPSRADDPRGDAGSGGIQGSSGIQPTLPASVDPDAPTVSGPVGGGAMPLPLLADTGSASPDGVATDPDADTEVPSRGSPKYLVVIAAILLLVGASGYEAYRRSRASSTREGRVPAPVDATRDDARSSATPEGAVAAGAASPSGAEASDSPKWIRIDPPPAPVVLGVPQDDARSHVLHPRDRVSSPSASYEIMDAEVTWGEFEPYLARQHINLEDPDPLKDGERPLWLPADPGRRASYPVVGVSRAVASEYCAAVGGRLPSEAEWEFAARGSELRGLPVADADPASLVDRIGPVRLRGDDVVETTSGKLYDMAGNAREWVASASSDASWSVTRGLPLNLSDGTNQVPPEAPLAHRSMMCATNLAACGVHEAISTLSTRRLQVGFRCVRDVR